MAAVSSFCRSSRLPLFSRLLCLSSPPRSPFRVCPHPSRRFASPSPHRDLALLQSLQSQLKQQAQSGSLQEQPLLPAPFQLVHRPNTREIFLYRCFREEKIEISCVYHDQTYGEGYDEEEDGFDPRDPNVPMKMVQMTIKVSLGDEKPFLEIVCCTFGDKTSIERVLLKEKNPKLNELPYEGPDISELNDDIKAGFVDYLSVRGINDQLGKFLLAFMPMKDREEYSRWLRKIEKFLHI